MPRIPTNQDAITFSAQPVGGPRVSEHDASLRGGPEALAQGVADLGRGIGQLGRDIQRNKERVDYERGTLWLSEAMSQLGTEYTDFITDERNRQSETIDQKFDKMASKRLSAYVTNAPDEKRAREFMVKATNMTNSYRARAISMGANTRVQNRLVSFESQIGSLGAEIDSLNQGPNPEQNRELFMGKIALMDESIRESWDIYPETQARLLSGLYTSAAKALVRSDPVAARQLAQSEHVSVDARNTIIARIEANTEAIDNGLRNEGARRQRTAINFAATNLQHVPDEWGEEWWKEAYPESWQPRLQAWEETVRAQNTAVDMLKPYRGTNSRARAEMVAKAKAAWDKDPTNPVKESVYQAVAERSKEWGEEEKRDLVSYMTRYHPVISEAAQAAFDDSLPADQRATALSLYHSLLEQYQGFPRDRKENHGLYFGRPTTDRWLISEQEALTYGQRISTLNTEEFNAAYAELAQRFLVPGDPATSAERLSDAFGDMVKFDAVDGMYELAFNWAGEPELGNILTAFKMYGSMDKLGSGSEKIIPDNMRAALRLNPDWQAFKDSVIQGGQRADRIRDYQNGVIAYAVSLMVPSDGKKDRLSEQAAVDQAATLLVGTKTKSVRYDGEHAVTIAVQPRDRSKPRRTPDVIRDLTDGLSDTINQFNRLQYGPDEDPAMWSVLEQISLKDPYGNDLFPDLNMLATEEDKLRQLAMKIGNRGYWETDRHAQGATLWMHGDGGFTKFELMDKRGNPIRVDWDFYTSVSENLSPEQVQAMRRFPTGLSGGIAPAPAPFNTETRFDFPNQGVRFTKDPVLPPPLPPPMDFKDKTNQEPAPAPIIRGPSADYRQFQLDTMRLRWGDQQKKKSP